MPGWTRSGPFPYKGPDGVVLQEVTPLQCANMLVIREKVCVDQALREPGGPAAAETRRNSLEAIRRLLSRVQAVPAVSWLWPRGGVPSSAARSGASDEGSAGAETASAPPLTAMLPTLRRRPTGRALTPAVLSRWVGVCALVILGGGLARR